MANNQLSTRIILRNDSTANWLANESQILLKGEVGIEFQQSGKVKMKIGDGKSTWSQLAYFGGDEGHVFELTVEKGGVHIGTPASEGVEATGIYTVIGDTTVNKGDIAIIKEEMIARDNEKLNSTDPAIKIEQQYQYTAYVFDGAVWKAMDGNYSADNVYFNEDFVFTTNVGTVTGVSSSKVVDAAGKSVKQFFSGLFAKETAGGKKTDPYASVTLKNGSTSITADTSYEVGTTVNPGFSASFEDGAYTYGPEPTGVTVTTWEIDSSTGEEWTSTSGTGTSFTVGDSTNYYITAKANHTAGNYAKSNIGNVGTYRFAEGSKSATSKKITGYRAQFYGAQVTPIDITSDKIRTLNACKPGNTFTGKYGSGNGFKLTVPEGCKQVVIALYGKTLKNVYDNAAFGTDIVGNFTEVSSTSAVAVEGANDYSAANYNVYVYAPDAALGANTYDCIIG